MMEGSVTGDGEEKQKEYLGTCEGFGYKHNRERKQL